ncbi:MAG: hypothetical protein IKC03_09185, partial [Oscillospiraceae bacterium]|nr:hypothetical protein [Oscillospiraceae bacterium]
MFRLKNGAESGVRVEATIWIMGGVVATILMSCVFRRAFGCQDYCNHGVILITAKKFDPNTNCIDKFSIPNLFINHGEIMAIVSENDITKRLINNDSLFNNIFVYHQNFDIIPSDKPHYGASIAYQDICELKEDFINELYDTIIDWVYGTEKYRELKEIAVKKGKSEQAANSEVQRKAQAKFRGNSSSESLLIQGQLG